MECSGRLCTALRMLTSSATGDSAHLCSVRVCGAVGCGELCKGLGCMLRGKVFEAKEGLCGSMPMMCVLQVHLRMG